MSDITTSMEFEDHIVYNNYYHCPACDHDWEDQWDSMCNDRCPVCRSEIEPYTSEEV